jgi:calcineurin-like phosphoesterase family protein
MLGSDLHLGHRAICKYRTEFESAEDHHETIFENFASNINKRDSVILLGDVAFTKEWLYRLKEIKCQKMTLVIGNHDTERNVGIRDLAEVFDEVSGLFSKRNCWFSHCPMHPDELRGKKFNIHGHTHDYCIDDSRYINICVEHTEYKPISFQELMAGKL